MNNQSHPSTHRRCSYPCGLSHEVSLVSRQPTRDENSILDLWYMRISSKAAGTVRMLSITIDRPAAAVIIVILLIASLSRGAVSRAVVS
jgi:hypothetical protein